MSSARVSIEERIPPAECVKLISGYLTYITTTNDRRIDAQKRKPTRFHAKTIPSIDILGYLSRILKYSPCSTESLLAIIIYFERVSLGNSLLFSPHPSKSNLVQDDTTITMSSPVSNSSNTNSSLDDVVVGDNKVDSMQRQFSSTHINGSEERIIACDQPAVVIDSYNIHRLLITAALVSIKFLSDVFYTNLHVSRVGGVSVNELNQMELEFLKMIDFSLVVSDNELVQIAEKLLLFSITSRPEAAISPASS